MPYQLIYSSYGNNNSQKMDTSLIGQFKNNAKNALVYSLTEIELGLFSPNSYYSGAFSKIFNGINESLSSSLNASLSKLSTDPIVGAFLPGAIRSLANPVFNLISGTGNAIIGASTGFARDSLVTPTRNAIISWFGDSPTATQVSGESGSSSFWGDLSDSISGAASGAYNSISYAVSNPGETLSGLGKSFGAQIANYVFGNTNNAADLGDLNLRIGEMGNYAQSYNPNPPKNKFLFKVAFFANQPYASMLGDEFYCYIHATELPKINFEYEKVNYYNYKTEVLKSTSFSDIKMKFYDDTDNNVLDFINEYVKCYIPIRRGTDLKALDPRFYPIYSMDFDENPLTWFSSNTTLLKNNNLNVISHIIISHVHYTNKFDCTQYLFVNPRIRDISLGDLSHSSSENNEIEISIGYDTFFVDTVEGIEDAPMYNFGDKDLFFKNYDPQLGGSKTRSDLFDEIDLDDYSNIFNTNKEVMNNQTKIMDFEYQLKADEMAYAMTNNKYTGISNPTFFNSSNDPYNFNPATSTNSSTWTDKNGWTYDTKTGTAISSPSQAKNNIINGI